MGLSLNDLDSITCDKVFGLYLREIATKVNFNFYKQVMKFVFLYRECLNEYGWLKRREHYERVEMTHQDFILADLKKKEDEENDSPK